jgi:hypothetical protein
MEPPDKVVGKNQPGFSESVDIPPEIFTRGVTGEDEGGTKDELDQIQKTPDPVSSWSFLDRTPPAKSGKPP